MKDLEDFTVLLHVMVLFVVCTPYVLSSRLYSGVYINCIHFFSTDDVYVGIVADRVHGIHRLDIANYYDWAYDPLSKKLLRWRFDNLVFYHNQNLNEMNTLWFYYCNFRSCRWGLNTGCAVKTWQRRREYITVAKLILLITNVL